jgi:hypothetical protein
MKALLARLTSIYMVSVSRTSAMACREKAGDSSVWSSSAPAAASSMSSSMAQSRRNSRLQTRLCPRPNFSSQL